MVALCFQVLLQLSEAVSSGGPVRQVHAMLSPCKACVYVCCTGTCYEGKPPGAYARNISCAFKARRQLDHTSSLRHNVSCAVGHI